MSRFTLICLLVTTSSAAAVPAAAPSDRFFAPLPTTISIKVYYRPSLGAQEGDPEGKIRESVAGTNRALSLASLPVILDLICVEAWTEAIDWESVDWNQFDNEDEVFGPALLEHKGGWKSAAGSADAVFIAVGQCATGAMVLSGGRDQPLGILGLALLNANGLGYLVGAFMEVPGIGTENLYSWFRRFGASPNGQTPSDLGTAEHESVKQAMAERAPSVADNGNEIGVCPVTGLDCADEVFCASRDVCGTQLEVYCPKKCGLC